MLTATQCIYDFMTNFMTNGGIDMPTYAELRQTNFAGNALFSNKLPIIEGLKNGNPHIPTMKPLPTEK